LVQIIKSTNPQLVHLHSSKAGLAGRLALRGSIPTVFQPHGWSFLAAPVAMRKLVAGWERAALRWTHALICVSEGERSLGVAEGIHSKVHVVPNGVDTQALTAVPWSARGAARAELGIDDGPTCVCIGRLHRPKGQDLLLQAWSRVLEAVPQARLYLVGDGPDADEFRRSAGKTITFTGHRDDASIWLAAADVVVIPSRWEGMSLTMLEAMASARSCVSTDVPGARDALHAGSGAVVPVGDDRALALEIARRLNEPELAQAEGVQGRRRAENHFKLGDATAAVARIYSSVLSRPTWRT
jgi:glycosyltransferase involved in cell wall biosynthesis